jgi:Fe-Mn family superoxide dismutase
MTFELPKLKYEYDSLYPYIDKITMKIHYEKHHQSYINNLNKAIKGTNLENKKIEEILKQTNSNSSFIKNNSGGHYNHSLFWSTITPKTTFPKGNLLNSINKKFKNFQSFKEKFSEASMNQFGSGWSWLLVDRNKELHIISTPNQDNPIMNIYKNQGIPILCLDMWEHAYYINYQNRKADYISAFWNIINWDEVEIKFEKYIA